MFNTHFKNAYFWRQFEATMRKLLSAFYILLSIATGCLFVYSAYTKLAPTIQAFEYNIAGRLGVHYLTASIAARFFIALEAGLGALIALHFFGLRKWVLKAAFALVTIFSIYLVWLWAKVGNDVNCGCFGDTIWMSPSVSLLKNALILVVLALLIRRHRGISFYLSDWIPAVVLACVFTTGYIIFPVFRQYKLDFTAMYADQQYAPPFDLTKGKHIIAFLSRNCMHCRRAALKMHNMKNGDTTLPFYFIIGGTDTALSSFWKDSKAEDMPYTRMEEKPFNKYTGGEFPQILWVNNGTVEANTTYPELDSSVIKEWLK